MKSHPLPPHYKQPLVSMTNPQCGNHHASHISHQKILLIPRDRQLLGYHIYLLLVKVYDTPLEAPRQPPWPGLGPFRFPDTCVRWQRVATTTTRKTAASWRLAGGRSENCYFIASSFLLHVNGLLLRIWTHPGRDEKDRILMKVPSGRAAC